MAKKEQIIPYQKPVSKWVVFKRSFKLLAPIPYTYTIPELKYFKKHKQWIDK